jgi:hypothetical protein
VRTRLPSVAGRRHRTCHACRQRLLRAGIEGSRRSCGRAVPLTAQLVGPASRINRGVGSRPRLGRGPNQVPAVARRVDRALPPSNRGRIRTGTNPEDGHQSRDGRGRPPSNRGRIRTGTNPEDGDQSRDGRGRDGRGRDGDQSRDGRGRAMNPGTGGDGRGRGRAGTGAGDDESRGRGRARATGGDGDGRGRRARVGRARVGDADWTGRDVNWPCGVASRSSKPRAASLRRRILPECSLACWPSRSDSGCRPQAREPPVSSCFKAWAGFALKRPKLLRSLRLVSSRSSHV